ncbi:MAG TPA: class I mannose-6-phosphate isomerase [Kiritimatiellia bacterium]|nr:class I mannose-6-phosphate isomerase [Kiritimatiellia bacterium]HMP32746.1 class I mannose-6-phosphate isomerase [Kiritimatiellia bacterium]
MQTWEPLSFKPVYQTYLWGGRQLVDRLARTDAPASGPVAESWELSDRTDGMSLVAGGTFAGTSLRSLMTEHRDAVIGKAACPGPFPLLIKVIDARETLSVQVHPDDAAAARGIGEAKSEAWYVLDAQPGACVYRGFRPGTTEAEAYTAIAEGRVADLLVRQSVVPGDTIYIPGGTVHAIGEGCLLLEVQQNSNTTYRLFDWNRTGPDGKPRALHLEEARQVIHWETEEQHQPAEGGRCVTPYFSIEPVTLGKRPVSLNDPLRGYTVLFVEEGPVRIDHPNGSLEAATGTTWLIPAALRGAKVARPGTEPARVVIIHGAKAG